MHTIYTGVLTLAFLISGCSLMGNPDNPDKNRHPKRAYEITVIIDDAPGPFDSVTGGAGYRVVNAADCVPQDPLSGVHPAPNYSPPDVLSRVSENVYRGKIYLDFLRDENYYLKGDCHWELGGFGATLNVHGANFRTVVSREDVVSEKTIVEYQQKRLYLDKSATDMNIFSNPMSDEIAKKRDAYFAVTLTAKEIRHE